MSRLFRLDIARKMFLGYLPLALLITVTAVFALRSLERVQAVNSGIVRTDVPLIEASTSLVDALLAQELYGRRYLILRAPDMLEVFWKRSEEANRLIGRIRDLLGARDEAVERVGALHEEYNRLFILDTRTAEQPPEGAYSELSKARHKEMLELAGALSSRFRGRLQDKNAWAAAFGMRAYRVTALLCSLGMLVGLGSAVIITRNISGSIRRLKVATDRVAEGEFENLPAVNSRDELGELSAAFREMARKLKDLEEISLDMNALTRLPGGVAIQRVVHARLADLEPFAFCLVDLDNFKVYNDRYGYARGSELIHGMAELLREVFARLGDEEDFLGHVGGDDFVIVTTPERYEPLCRAIVEAFDAWIPSTYALEDRRRGYVVGKTRQGQTLKFPLMTVSIAVVTSARHRFDNHVQVGEVAAELKDYAKSRPGSKWVVDRRGADPKGDVEPAAVGEET
ncbi:MAG: HAMP domain-containing protein [Deltaproteobacteria bacterium]|nr:HAMP domain-containing protein [Deltaproteobacteria bacterium]